VRAFHESPLSLGPKEERVRSTPSSRDRNRFDLELGMQPQVSCSLQSPAAARRAANGATVRRPEAQKLMQLPSCAKP
jgi:hypothetical protein